VQDSSGGAAAPASARICSSGTVPRHGVLAGGRQGSAACEPLQVGTLFSRTRQQSCSCCSSLPGWRHPVHYLVALAAFGAFGQRLPV
jgi:hypothetical protein